MVMKAVFLSAAFFLFASICLGQNALNHFNPGGNNIRSLGMLRFDHVRAVGLSPRRLPVLSKNLPDITFSNYLVNSRMGPVVLQSGLESTAISGNRFDKLPTLNFYDNRQDYDFSGLIHSLGALWLRK